MPVVVLVEVVVSTLSQSMRRSAPLNRVSVRQVRNHVLFRAISDCWPQKTPQLLQIWKDHRKTVIYITHDIEEAVLLGDRVLVMSGRPGRIRQEFPVPLGRPRDLSASDHPEVIGIKWSIWKLLEDEVRKGLQIPA